MQLVVNLFAVSVKIHFFNTVKTESERSLQVKVGFSSVAKFRTICQQDDYFCQRKRDLREEDRVRPFIHMASH